MSEPKVGFKVRRLSITREMIKRLSEIKRDNRGSIANTVEVYLDEVGDDLGDLTVLDIVRFAENCERMLAEWRKPECQCCEYKPTAPV